MKSPTWKRVFYIFGKRVGIGCEKHNFKLPFYQAMNHGLSGKVRGFYLNVGNLLFVLSISH